MPSQNAFCLSFTLDVHTHARARLRAVPMERWPTNTKQLGNTPGETEIPLYLFKRWMHIIQSEAASELSKVSTSVEHGETLSLSLFLSPPYVDWCLLESPANAFAQCVTMFTKHGCALFGRYRYRGIPN